MDKNIAVFLRDDAKTIGVRFIKDKFKDESSLELGNNDSLTLSDREYTYVTDLDIKVGDIVAVYAVGIPKLAFVSSVHTEVEIEPNETIQYKWVIAKLDISAYLENCKKNAEIERTLGRAYKANVRKQFRDVLLSQVDEVSRNNLLSILGAKNECQE